MVLLEIVVVIHANIMITIRSLPAFQGSMEHICTWSFVQFGASLLGRTKQSSNRVIWVKSEGMEISKLFLVSVELV